MPLSSPPSCRHLSDILGCSWVELAQRLDRAGTLHRWQAREPLLAVGSVNDLATSGFDIAADDRLGCLIRLSAPTGSSRRDRADADDAVLVALHLLAGPIRRMAFQLRSDYVDPMGCVIGQMTEQIKSFPHQRRRAYAMNLIHDAEARLLAERRMIRSRRVRPCDVVLLAPVARVTDAPQQRGTVSLAGGSVGALPVSQLERLIDALALRDGGNNDDDDLTFAEVAAWALQTGRVDRCGLETLLQVTELRCSAPRGRNAELVAARYGISRTTVDRRCTRTLRALRAAGPDFLRHRDHPWDTSPTPLRTSA